MEKWRQKLQVKYMTHSQRKFCSTGEVDRFKTLNYLAILSKGLDGWMDEEIVKVLKCTRHIYFFYAAF